MATRRPQCEYPVSDFSFSQAFEITDDDILTVLIRLGLPHEDEDVERWADLVKVDLATKAALDCDSGDLDDQTVAAHDELARQIGEAAPRMMARERHEQVAEKGPTTPAAPRYRA